MNVLQKPFKTVDEQIHILQSRGLKFLNEDTARKKLLNCNYYTIINGYKYPFLQDNFPEDAEKFRSGTTFEELYALYEFDCNIRALFLKYILLVEHQLKSVISYTFSEKHPDIPYPEYLSEEYYDVSGLNSRKKSTYDSLRKHIDEEIQHQLANNNQVLSYYQSHYNNIPPWILLPMLSFGMMRSFYCCLNNQDQNNIGRAFNLRPHELSAYLSALNTYRNSCAHNERVYCLKLKNKISRKGKLYNSIYVIVLILKDILDAETFMSFYSSLDIIINSLSDKLTTVSVSDILYIMGIPVDPEVRKADLGELNKGTTLSTQEFHDILVRYILPMFSVSVSLQEVSDDDSVRANSKCSLVEYENNRFYFAQSTVEAFSFFVPFPDSDAAKTQIGIIREHLTILIDYIHVFWNFSNLSIYVRDKVEIAFPNLCEQAYELTICNLTCNKERIQAGEAYSNLEREYKRVIGTLSKSERTDWIKKLHSSKAKYLDSLKREAIEQQTLYKIINQVEEWSRKTYEGQKRTFGIIICKNEYPDADSSFNYIDFLKTDYSATINDGLYSAVELYADGSFKSHVSIFQSPGTDLPSIPYPFTGFAELCTNDKIGVLLTPSEDIMIISNQKLRYTKHNGYWLRSNADQINEQLIKEISGLDCTSVSAILQTITDLSYSRGGACIAIIDEDSLPNELNEMIKSGLLTSNPLTNKQSAIRGLIINTSDNAMLSFYNLNRHLRRELLELDGAMVFSKSGLIHVVGTIVKLSGGGSEGGGRTAAAIQLSEFGLSIKVSQDGYVQFYKDRRKIFEMFT